MNIKFRTIDISGFRSIDKAKIDLEQQGTVIVKGINEYEDKATSNGSGKSSIFEAIIYALFEETSSGEKDVENRILGNGFCITLKLDIDGDSYTIVREGKKNKTSVLLYKNEQDISARNKTDTNKLIVSLLGITKDIFLDSIFLSQNAVTNLASLAPTARKERLEILTSTDSLINTFKDKLKQKQIEYESECVNSQSTINKLLGQENALNSQKLDIINRINEIQEQINKRNALGNIDDINIEITKNETDINNLKEQIKLKEDEINNQEKVIEDFRKTGDNNLEEKDKQNSILEEKRQEYSNLQNQCSTVQFEISNIQKEIVRLEGEITKIQNSDTCPTCGRKYDNVNEEHIQKTINEFKSQIDEQNVLLKNKTQELSNLTQTLTNKQEEGKKLNEELETINEKIKEHKNQLDVLESQRKKLLNEKQNLTDNVNSIDNNIQVLRNKKEEILKIEIGNKEEFEGMLKDVETKLTDLENQKQKETDNYNSNNDYVNTVKHMIQLVTKEFRTYLLQNSINYLNKLLQQYSSQLFSNTCDIIKISSDDTKLNIQLGNATYESLSGGEKTRVNIALLLAQKSLANVIGNISCNMIILDEILGYCDSSAESNVIQLLTKELEALESIYIVSHKEIPVGYDTQITVTKNKNGLSSVRNY